MFAHLVMNPADILSEQAEEKQLYAGKEKQCCEKCGHTRGGQLLVVDKVDHEREKGVTDAQKRN